MAAVSTETAPRPELFARVKAMSLFRREAPAARAWDAIGWWESRRIPYNLIVGCAGMLTSALLGILVFAHAALERQLSGDFGNPFFGAVALLAYAVGANVLYTFGWISELVIRALWPRESGRFATASFSLGVVFSVLLTLAPGVVAVAIMIAVGVAKLAGMYR